MALQVITCEGVASLIAKLMQEGRVVAPQRREGKNQWAWADVSDPGDVCLDYASTVLPPKQYAFPPKEKLVHYELAERPRIEAVIEAEPLVIFGAHPCDIYGLTALDTAFGDQNVDPNYCSRRAQMRIVGVDCQPDEWCFCGSMGTASVSEGYDLFLSQLNGEYLAEVATAAGAAMLEGLPTREATAAELAVVKENLAKKVQQERKLNAEYHTLPMHLQGQQESPVWEEWAKRCYSCGTCNLTCPTCFCFDVLDKMDLSLSSGHRERQWDGCMLEAFATVASGENFRADRDERLRHRFYRKYAYLFAKYGRPYCCGCGRCVRQCLVHIDPVGILNDVVAQSGKEA